MLISNQFCQLQQSSTSDYNNNNLLSNHTTSDDDDNEVNVYDDLVKPIISLIDNDTLSTKNNRVQQMIFNPQQQQHINMASNDATSQPQKLFVGNLPPNTRLCELLSVFRKYGRINDKLSVIKDQNYGFVHFYNEQDARRALEECNDSLFKDRFIRVQYSTSKGHVKKSNTFETKKELLEQLRKQQLQEQQQQVQQFDLYNLDQYFSQFQRPVMTTCSNGSGRALVGRSMNNMPKSSTISSFGQQQRQYNSPPGFFKPISVQQQQDLFFDFLTV